MTTFEGDVFDDPAEDQIEDEFLGEEFDVTALMGMFQGALIDSAVRACAERGVEVTAEDLQALTRNQFASLMLDIQDPSHRHYYDWDGDVWTDENGQDMNGPAFSVSALLIDVLAMYLHDFAVALDLLKRSPGFVLHPEHSSGIVELLEGMVAGLEGVTAYPTNPLHPESETTITANMQIDFQNEDSNKAYVDWMRDRFNAEVLRRRDQVDVIKQGTKDGHSVEEAVAKADEQYPPVNLDDAPISA